MGQYKIALISLTVLLIVVLIQNFLSAYFKIVKAEQPPGLAATGTNEDFTFRVYRSHMNSIENLSAFVACVFIAMVAGANPTWVNLLATIHVIARIGFWMIYLSGIGKVAGGPRTMVFVIGWAVNLALAFVAFGALI